MLDLIGAITGAALYAVVVGVLIGLSPARGAAKIAAAAAAAAWGGMIVAVTALGGFAPGATGSVPAPGFAFAGALALLFGAWFLLPRLRSALLAAPLPALVAVNAGRLGGVFFLILFAQDRLSSPFAPAAGGGDILVGALALPLAVLAGRRAYELAGWLGLWNALGALDLVVAISLGLLSAPGSPFRVFTEGPGTLAMTVLPWIMIPTMIVPLYLLIHFTIAVKLRSLQAASGAVAMAG